MEEEENEDQDTGKSKDPISTRSSVGVPYDARGGLYTYLVWPLGIDIFGPPRTSYGASAEFRKELMRSSYGPHSELTRSFSSSLAPIRSSQRPHTDLARSINGPSSARSSHRHLTDQARSIYGAPMDIIRT